MRLEKRIWNLATVLSLLLVLLSARIVYWQLVRGSQLQPVALDPASAAREYARLQAKSWNKPEDPMDLLDNPASFEGLPQPVIQRTAELLASITRGSIYDRNGRPLAYDQVSDGGQRSRFYSEPSLAHVIGYVSGIRTGISGLERSYNATLLGLDRPGIQLGRLVHQPIVGSDLILTIDSRVQQVAEQALEAKMGAIVVLDARTGAVLAMASSPRYDPNRVLEANYVGGLLNNCSNQPGCEAPFLNRATQALYIPGSTWKTVTLIAALDTGQVSPETVFDFGKPVSGPNGPYYVYRVDGGVIPDPNHRESRLNLEQSYAKSANAAFARMGDEMPPQVMIDYASRLGFSSTQHFPFEIELSRAQLARDTESIRTNNLLRAVTAIGQGELLASPLNMAMVVLSAQNNGDMPVPYFVQAIQDPSGQLVDLGRNREVVRRVMRPETAQLVREIMIAVIQQGTGGRAGVEGLVVGGKTGTAQVDGNSPPHAWFTGFAQNEERGVVIAVLIENGGSGSQAAAPIFARLADVAIHQLGQPVELTRCCAAVSQSQNTSSIPLSPDKWEKGAAFLPLVRL